MGLGSTHPEGHPVRPSGDGIVGRSKALASSSHEKAKVCHTLIDEVFYDDLQDPALNEWDVACPLWAEEESGFDQDSFFGL